MLIKRKKLAHIKQVQTVVPQEVSLSVRVAKLEIQKSQEEAKKIKEDAHNILEESQRKLKEAEQKVKEIIQNTTIEAKQLKERTYNEALAKAQEEGEVVKEQARILIKELFKVKEKALYQAHKEIIQIALDLAGKILRYQAQVDPEVLKTQVVDAIKKATSEADRVQVFVNPANLKLLEDSLEDLKKLFPGSVDIVPLIRDSVDPGSCIVETKSGQLDATFSTQLQSLTNLIANLEVKEPEIKIDETIEATDVVETELSIEEELQSLEPTNLSEIIDISELPETELSIEEELQSIEAPESALTKEEELLKEELIGEEPLIDLQDEEAQETFPFEAKFEVKPEVKFEVKQVEPQAITLTEEEILEPGSILQEEDIIPQPIQDKIRQDEATPQSKRKIMFDDISERTIEEAEELDELTLFDVEDDIEEVIEEPKIETKSVLRRKKDVMSNQADQGQISEIAKEIEKSSEWKDLIQNDDDE